MRFIKTPSKGIVLFVFLSNLSLAETITVGKGMGIIWEGLPFNETLSGPMYTSSLTPRNGLLAITNSSRGCIIESALKNIGGYLALPLGNTGLGLIPKATAYAIFDIYGNGSMESLNGTIGYPETKGRSSNGENIFNPIGYYHWCLPPSMTEQSKFYGTRRSATLRGTWLIVADGNQVSGEATMEPMYFGSFTDLYLGNMFVRILPPNITFRVSNLECVINTPTSINFNVVGRNVQNGAELSKLSYPFITSCSQTSNLMTTNINVQFSAITGLFENNKTRLSLAQSGGYITGEIDGGVTGSGNCTGNTGVSFDNSKINLGAINSKETSKYISNQITWRLCSGGNSLPTGPVNAATEMYVTFN